jgi:predicted N-acetyltransferase YhbS
MAKKRNKQRPSALPQVTRERLVQGWPVPGGSRIRLAKPQDAEAVAGLLKLATTGIESAHIDAIADGRLGAWLLDGLRDPREAMMMQLVRTASAGHLPDAALQLSLPLVAENRDGEVVGAMLALPPGTVTALLANTPGMEMHGLLAMLKFAKIKALAVAEHARGQNLGTALLKRGLQLYWQLDFRLVYGEFTTGSGLETYYRRHGFTVMEEGEQTDVGYILTGRPVLLGADAGERMFYRWRR